MKVSITNEMSDGIAHNEKGDANRKYILLARAQQYFHNEDICIEDRYYASIKQRLKGVPEPHVETSDLFDLDAAKAFVTVNFYNAAVLNSRNMIVVDVDFADNRCTHGTFVPSVAKVVDSLCSLDVVDRYIGEDGIEPRLTWADQSFRVYRTRNGCRVVCTSTAAPWDEDHVLPLMRFLGADNNYIHLCEEHGTYRARLTPKPWNDNGGASHVCQLAYQHGYDIVAPELMEQVQLHDEMVLPAAPHAGELYLA